MKRKSKITYFIASIIFVVIALFAFNLHLSLQNDKTDQQIDSLIKIQRLNDKTILIGFCSDSVTAIKTQKGIVVIDAGISTCLTAKYRITIENEFKRNNVTFNLIFFGKAHSDSDILIHLPELKILFIGDLFFKYGRPSLNVSNKTDFDRWFKVIEWIETRMDGIDLIDGVKPIIHSEKVYPVKRDHISNNAG